MHFYKLIILFQSWKLISAAICSEFCIVDFYNGIHCLLHKKLEGEGVLKLERGVSLVPVQEIILTVTFPLQSESSSKEALSNLLKKNRSSGQVFIFIFAAVPKPSSCRPDNRCRFLVSQPNISNLVQGVISIAS